MQYACFVTDETFETNSRQMEQTNKSGMKWFGIVTFLEMV